MERLHKVLWIWKRPEKELQDCTICNKYFSPEAFISFLYRLVCIRYLKHSICSSICLLILHLTNFLEFQCSRFSVAKWQRDKGNGNRWIMCLKNPNCRIFFLSHETYLIPKRVYKINHKCTELVTVSLGHESQTIRLYS